MAVLFARTNQALEINPPAGDQYLTVNGSNWLWTVTAIYVLSFVIFYGLSFKPKSGEKVFHYLFSIALLVGSISYFAMASDLAWTVVPTANNIDTWGATRQIFFAKYINWVVSFPVVIIALGLLSAVSWATIVYNVFLSWTWIISYLVSAYTETNYKWGFYAFGTVAWILLAVSTFVDARAGAARVGTTRDYFIIAGWTNLLWLLYPIAFGLSDGGNRIGVTASFIFFGILDVLMIPVIAYSFVGLANKWDYGKLNLYFTQYGRVAQGGNFPEKAPAAAPAAAPAVAPAGEQAV